MLQAELAQLAEVAEPLSGPTLQAVLQAVREHDVSVVVGIAENHNGTYFNTSVLVTPDGIALQYRKTHLWPSEDLVFAGGSSVVDPFGQVLFEAGREEVRQVVDLDFAALKAARREYDYLKDRRLYLSGEQIEQADGRRELLIGVSR